jgi:hypothetical protein
MTGKGERGKAMIGDSRRAAAGEAAISDKLSDIEAAVTATSSRPISDKLSDILP